MTSSVMNGEPPYLMRADRLIGMLMLLQSHRRLSADRLAGELGVSPRTILRDIEALRYAGVPITTVRGQGGGVELREGFRTELTGINDEEAGVLLLAGNPELAERLGLADATDSARRKLLQALAPEHREIATGLDDWLRIEVPEPQEKGEDHGRLPRLVRAIRERRLVRLRSWGGRPRTVRPAGLVIGPRGWRLELHDGDPVGLDDIREMRLLAHYVEAPANGN